MSLPSNFLHHSEWVLLGPMGPELSDFLSHLPVMAIDGGAHFTKKIDIWLGDADSIKQVPDATKVLKFPPEKDLSDLALGFSLLEQDRSYTIHLWGFLGGRHDHELFNLGEAAKFLENCTKSRIFFYDRLGQKRFEYLSQGKWELSIHSLFSLGSIKTVNVTLEGQCRYPICPAAKLTPLSSQGLSNIGQGQITLCNDAPVFIYYPEAP